MMHANGLRTVVLFTMHLLEPGPEGPQAPLVIYFDSPPTAWELARAIAAKLLVRTSALTEALVWSVLERAGLDSASIDAAARELRADWNRGPAWTSRHRIVGGALFSFQLCRLERTSGPRDVRPAGEG